METGKPGLASAPVHINAVAAQTEKRMDIQAPLTAVYIHTVPALPAQPYPQPPAAAREPATLHLAMPPLYSKETLPFLTLHIAGGLQSQPGLSLAAASPAARPKSAGKHVCPHCGRDCMKPSVLEKHLRCHTGERPYPCTTCGISFKTQSNLYKHKRTQAHARLSSESEQSSLGSLDSMSSSRETCASSLSLDESGSVEKDTTLPAAEATVRTAKVYPVKTQASVCEQDELTPADQKTKEPNESGKVTTEGEKQRMENEKPPLTAGRHLPLQRQEATLFSKQWESSVSRGKSQSHESTDSGFSESSDHYPSPGSILPDHSMDSLAESTKEHLEETAGAHAPPESGQGGQEPRDTAKEQEHKTLEERISKLISENTAVVEDKQLENVRPRKTVLSKQGSIDLPMPYTYKDSFHFDMKNSKTPNVGLQRNRKPGFYSSVPTQHSTTSMEHAPLTRSNSLPFSVTLLQPERSSPTSSYHSDYVTLVRRGSSGQINPTGFAIKPVNQQSSTHRPLVRQTAVDCNHATDGLFMNSSVEEACTSSLSCDGDAGDICGEPSNRKFRRKKAQKFAYNKWYMYGGGTFKKLYNNEKGGDDSAVKGKKCATNPEHEVVQGLQKRLSAVQKEATATTGPAVIFKSGTATAAHPDGPPAKLSVVSAHLNTGQLHSSCSSLKSPLRRNLSLSVLPLPLIGSLVSHRTDSMSRVEDGRLINEEKPLDSSLQRCEAQIPSDRKKQKTDDKVICPLEMETDPNGLTHPPPPVTGSATQQDTNLSYVNLQTNRKHAPLKGAVFTPCIINANVPSVSTSPATSSPSAAKTSFLPKYQLKLPNAPEPDSNPSPHVVDTASRTDGRSFTSAPSSSRAEQTPPSVTTSEKKCSAPVTSPSMQSCEIKTSNAFSCTQGQLLLPCTPTALCHAVSPNKDATSCVAVVHRQFAAATITTTCLQDYQAGLCSTSVQPSRCAGGTAPLQLHSVAPVVANFPATPTVTTANSRTPAAAITAFSQGQPPHNPPPSHTQPVPASDQPSPANRARVASSAPVVPCHVVPFDQMPPASQNVFHVHTADLQICLQIISDEQLALIEPQIERQAGSTLPQRRDVEAASPEVSQNKAQSFVTVESGNEGRDHQQPGHQKGPDQSETLPGLNTEKIKPTVSALCGKAEPNLHLTEHSNSTQATVSAEPKPLEALGSLRRPHKYAHVNKVTETQCITADVMSTAAPFKGVKSGRSQASEEEHAPSLNRSADEQHLPDRRVIQGGLVSQTLSSQHKLSVTPLSPSAVNQNSTRGEMPGNERQHKLKNQGATYNVGTMTAKGEAAAHKSSKSESGETHSPRQGGPAPAPGAACADELPGTASSFSVSKCKAPRRLVSQASIYCTNPAESALSDTLNSSKHANTGCDTVSPMDYSAPSQEMTLGESQGVISSARSEKHRGQFTSVSSNIQVGRPKDIPAVLTSVQNPTAGCVEGDLVVGCAAQREPHTLGHGGGPGQPDSADWRPKQSQEAEGIKYQCMEVQGDEGAAAEEKNRGIKTDEEPGQWAEPGSNCRYTCLQDVTKPEGDDRRVRADSFKNSWLSEQHLQHLSQTHSGMSEYPQQSHQPAPSMSNNFNSPACSSQTGPFNAPRPPVEMNNFYFPQQHWESGIIHKQQTQNHCESNSSQHVKAQAQFSDAQNTSESDSPRTQTLSHRDQKHDRKQTSITLSSQQGNTSAGNNITAVSCCTKSTSGSHKTSSSAHPSQVSYSVQVSRATAGLAGDTQASNSNALDNNTLTRTDITNKYQSFLFAGQLHEYQPAECLPSAVRPVQSCQDNTEDTSSSDDEGKLIIEL